MRHGLRMRTLLAVAFSVAVANGQQPADFLLVPKSFPARVATSAAGRELVLDNGILRATLCLEPDAALVSLRIGDRELLRAVRPFGQVTLAGTQVSVGGLIGQPNHAFLLPEWLLAMQANPRAFHYKSMSEGPIEARFPWQKTRHTAPDVAWPPHGVHVQLQFDAPAGIAAGMSVTVHLEMYDGLPLWCQWLEVHNQSDAPVELAAFTSVQLAVVEAESRVEPMRMGVRFPNLHVETDFAFHAMTGSDGSAHCVRWLPDPLFETQVNYERQTRCLLEVGPDLGPAQTIAEKSTFATFRTWLLAPDREDRERQSLAVRRMYRTIAPWSTENPVMMHVRSAEPLAVRAAIDQCAQVGFEMAILTFGSGFDIEDDSPQNLERWKALADYAHQQGIQLGGYSLLSSRAIEPAGDNCINEQTGKPGGQIFGTAPALASNWGQRYFQKLYRFFTYTGFDLLEHDGSYPGDPDAMARPPLQKGLADSQWVQHQIIANFYRWCRGRGIYLNVPDWYFLNGSNKTGMGYRETNWSLPREQQVLHTRQNLFDGTYDKLSSMGWMFVPLLEYQGGGAAATIEPLAEHLPHYERMMSSNLAYGAQACYRGPRLYDTDATKAMVQQQVAYFVQHRAILESEVIHTASRRADGSDLDWVLHTNPNIEERALLTVFNPTGKPRTRTLFVDLYYANLGASMLVEVEAPDGKRSQLKVSERGTVMVPVTVAEGGSSGWIFRLAK
jgi:hypothetical protein